MAEDSAIHQSWKVASHPDADVDLLQRSITHVEHLLNRLEYGSASPPQTNHQMVENPAPTPPEVPTDGRVDGSVAASLPTAVQADAWRIMLSAHDEANRIRAQAADVHAQAVAESERLLLEAEQLCDQLRADAVSAAQARADELRTASEAEAEAIRRDARSWADDAVAETAAAADTVRSLAHETLSGVIERLSDALECLQELTAALGPHAPLATALAETQRRPDAAADSALDSDPDSEFASGLTVGAAVLGDFPADAVGNDSVGDGHGAPIRSRRSGDLFRAPRR